MTRAAAHSPFPRLTRARRGFAAVYTVIILIALCGFVSLAVDLGRVQLAKTELQNAADASARAAALGMYDGASAATAAALDIASENLCDGTSISLQADADVQFGIWDSDLRTFTPVAPADFDTANAVRVTPQRIASRGTAIPLSFARVIGMSTCNVRASAIALVVRGKGVGFIALSGISLGNASFFGSYHPSITTTPTTGNCASNVMVGTNGSVTAGSNTRIQGDLRLGPSGSVSGALVVTGTTVRLSEEIPPPDQAPWTPGVNPGGVPMAYSMRRSVTLPGGTYWFTSLAIEGDLTFSGPATIYVNGNIALDGSLIAYERIPANLKIYQIGTGRTFGDSKGNGMEIVAQVWAPGSQLVVKNTLNFYGSGVFDSISTRNTCNFFYDESSGRASPGAHNVALVQ